MHYYDPDKNPMCPYCRQASEKFDDTDSFDAPSTTGNSQRSTARPDIETGIAGTHFPASIHEASGEETIGIFKKKAGFNPVVGWLVCTEGIEKGKDHPIRPGINEVGRDDTYDVHIVVKGDLLISRRDHAEIEYDAEENIFYLIRKKNQAVKVNGVKIRQYVKINAYDTIQFGETVFVFVPLCNDKFRWDTKQ
ncbi:MAG: FHA domain-containing protein [Nitrospirae bacterium]|nr:FHA domain-containing protein [Nitrospirota bacterium]